MSADNILIALQHEGKVRVHDFNFSDISCHPAWEFPLTESKIEELSDYVRSNKFNREIHKCDTFEQAEGFCKRHMRTNVVEYDYTLLRVEVEIADASQSARKSSKEKKRRRQIAKSARLA